MFRARIVVGRSTVFASIGAPLGLAQIKRRLAMLFIILIGGAFFRVSNAQAQVDLWLTDPSGSARFEKQKTGPVAGSAGTQDPVIEIDPKKTYQTID
ncbi:MAG TPA: hypothetical protein VGY53_02255, partial [Isosphaeraceae bacterium]|nr:hypothetical protein [Isosphaeraceae bacterium]